MLSLRIITSIILLPLAVLGIFYLPPMAFVSLVTLIIATAAWEMSGFFWKKNNSYRYLFVATIILLIVLCQMFSSFPILIIGGIWWLIVPYILARYAHNHKIDFFKLPVGFVAGVLTFVPCASGLITLRYDFGSEYLLLLLGLVWMADIGAYFAGKFYGKHLLAGSISPKKTMEGLLGGLTAALLIAVIVGIVRHLQFFAWIVWILFISVVVLWSVLGDLYESMLKRIAGVKDSGHILPGHGGLFDRIDSLTAAAPIFALGMAMLRI
jgi:phosphatidate cytidylyltransferase